MRWSVVAKMFGYRTFANVQYKLGKRPPALGFFVSKKCGAAFRIT